ncbi:MULTISPECIES: glutathione S-transferase family protein [Hydrocarboniphaga]|jgi:glutathione S-transferase|uniref:glutathione transferase n=1 Tax=Hydrocarboniphaga effusa AP103 TaxID=1172194 RepID=I7ZD04_9GAMM|nr:MULTISPECIES: glutathione S-transferase [Hydrocarboniphaga]EIT69774.1 putative glutathione S-transferase [Hydrocarboniphaga effusa AP103]MDZ4078844.1 glutathione S-transferase [Hydrocarboniphaga sp.]
MLTLHHLNNSRSQRILWLLEELGIAYEIKRYERNAKTMLAPPELRAVHPLGKSPLLSDDGLVIAESGAIIEYLLERYGHGRFLPAAGTPEFLRYRYWLHYAEGSLMPLLVMKLVLSTVPGRTPALIRPIGRAIVGGVEQAFLGPQLKLHLDYVEAELGKSQWLVCDDLTGADFQMSFPLEAASARAGGGAPRPRIKAFVERIQSRPAYRRALEKGGPYNILG